MTIAQLARMIHRQHCLVRPAGCSQARFLAMIAQAKQTDGTQEINEQFRDNLDSLVESFRRA